MLTVCDQVPDLNQCFSLIQSIQVDIKIVNNCYNLVIIFPFLNSKHSWLLWTAHWDTGSWLNAHFLINNCFYPHPKEKNTHYAFQTRVSSSNMFMCYYIVAWALRERWTNSNESHSSPVKVCCCPRTEVKNQSSPSCKWNTCGGHGCVFYFHILLGAIF